MNVIARLMQRLAPLILLAAGILFIVFGLIDAHQAKTFAPAMGTIRSIEVDNSGEDTRYTVIVEYTVDGTSYFADLGELKNGFAVGQEIDIQYNPADFEQIRLPGRTGMLACFGFGALMLLGAAVTTWRRLVYGR